MFIVFYPKIRITRKKKFSVFGVKPDHEIFLLISSKAKEGFEASLNVKSFYARKLLNSSNIYFSGYDGEDKELEEKKIKKHKAPELVSPKKKTFLTSLAPVSLRFYRGFFTRLLLAVCSRIFRCLTALRRELCERAAKTLSIFYHLIKLMLFLCWMKF